MKLSSRTFSLLLLTTFFVVTFASGLALAENRFVAVTGDDSNPGTEELPWRTLRTACLSLNPGDHLLVGPGEYVEFNDDGVDDFQDTIFLRSVGTEEEGFPFLPFVGDPDNPTVIRPWKRRSRPRIHGHFDIRGSYIQISGLEIVGKPERTIESGIAVFSSHDICCMNNVIHDHGGGGISFNQSDMVSALGNICFSNAMTNPNQSSAISTFQPIRRSPSDKQFGVWFQFNVCFDNRNEVPGDFGITDGNGIILDDHYYTQTNQLIHDAIAGLADPDGAGIPTIEAAVQENEAEEGQEPSTTLVPLPYNRKSFVANNLCFGNGGRGAHAFLADGAIFWGNVVFNNLQSEELFANLPTDDEGTPFFLNGELSSVDSTDIYFGYNVAIATRPTAVAANEFYFSLQPAQFGGNAWKGNRYFNFRGDLYSVVGIPELESNLVRDVD